MPHFCAEQISKAVTLLGENGLTNMNFFQQRILSREAIKAPAGQQKRVFEIPCVLKLLDESKVANRCPLPLIDLMRQKRPPFYSGHPYIIQKKLIHRG